jgi:type IV pilus assembly protein PilP
MYWGERKMIRVGRSVLVLCASFTLVACAGSMGDLEDWMTEVKGRRGAPLDPLPVLKTFDAFEYAAYDLREPFAPWDVGEDQAQTSSIGGPRPDPSRRKEALESHPLDALDMVGTIGLGPDMYGLVKAPDGVVYRVRPNNYMGQSDGRITGIREDRIELVELVPNGVGGWNEQPAVIPLENQ